MITSHAKGITTILLQGGYLRPVPNPKGRIMFRLFDQRHNSLQSFGAKLIRRYNVTAPEKHEEKVPSRILKKDNHGRLVISRAAVRKLHGNSIVKRAYIDHLKSTKNNGQDKISSDTSFFTTNKKIKNVKT